MPARQGSHSRYLGPFLDRFYHSRTGIGPRCGKMPSQARSECPTQWADSRTGVVEGQTGTRMVVDKISSAAARTAPASDSTCVCGVMVEKIARAFVTISESCSRESSIPGTQREVQHFATSNRPKQLRQDRELLRRSQTRIRLKCERQMSSVGRASDIQWALKVEPLV